MSDVDPEELSLFENNDFPEPQDSSMGSGRFSIGDFFSQIINALLMFWR